MEKQIYIYEGKKVVLANVDEAKNYGIEPIAVSMGVGCYDANGFPAELDCCLTIDECAIGATGEESEIVDAEIVNPENNQTLTAGWVTKEYLHTDSLEREFGVLTDIYHQWTSEASRFKNEYVVNKVFRNENGTECMYESDRLELEDRWGSIAHEAISLGVALDFNEFVRDLKIVKNEK